MVGQRLNCTDCVYLAEPRVTQDLYSLCQYTVHVYTQQPPRLPLWLLPDLYTVYILGLRYKQIHLYIIKLTDEQTLKLWCRGSSYYSTLGAVLDPVYHPLIAPDTLEGSPHPSASPMVSATTKAPVTPSPTALAMTKTSPARDANLLFFAQTASS